MIPPYHSALRHPRVHWHTETLKGNTRPHEGIMCLERFILTSHTINYNLLVVASSKLVDIHLPSIEERVGCKGSYEPVPITYKSLG